MKDGIGKGREVKANSIVYTVKKMGKGEEGKKVIFGSFNSLSGRGGRLDSVLSVVSVGRTG